MPRLFGIILLLTASFCSAQQPGLPSGAWVARNVRWRHSAIHKHEKWAHTRVLYFSTKGQFSILECSLVEANKAIELSDGDPITLYSGDWKSAGPSISVRYQLVYRDVPHVGISAAERKQRHTTLALRGPDIIFRKASYRREPRLDASATSKLSDLVPHASR